MTVILHLRQAWNGYSRVTISEAERKRRTQAGEIEQVEGDVYRELTPEEIAARTAKPRKAKKG